jgi:glycosyltransferase involved in cell wall biosynthesis
MQQQRTRGAEEQNAPTSHHHGTARVRVLIVAPSIEFLGGQAVQATRLHARLAAEPSLDVSLLPVNPPFPRLFRRWQAIKGIRSIRSTFLYWLTLLKHVRHYDVIHIFSASYWSFLIAPVPALFVAKLYGKKTLLNYHSGEAADHLERWRTALPLLRRADMIAVPSGYLVDVFARFRLSARSVYNLVETDHFVFRPRRPLRPIFLSNRNFEPHYNVSCVLRAFAQIQRRFPDASLILAGGGSQRSELESLARELGLRQTKFLGRIAPEQANQLYDGADIYLNGSNIDNMPLSILEAYSAGLPVVTTDAGGIPYIVKHEETGLLVSRNDPDAMAAAAIRLLEDEELAARLAQQAHHECRKYEWAILRRQWLNLYAELAHDAPAHERNSLMVDNKATPAGKP